MVPYLLLCHLDIQAEVGNRAKRDIFTESVKRKHLITKQDVANLKRKVCDMAVMRDPDDATSVQMMVNELEDESYNPVLIYKPQHKQSSEHPSLPADAFVLAIQTHWQKEMYRRFSTSVLCIDSTHSTNAYNFKLITCVVPDDFGKGMPYLKYMRINLIGNMGGFVHALNRSWH